MLIKYLDSIFSNRRQTLMTLGHWKDPFAILCLHYLLFEEHELNTRSLRCLSGPCVSSQTIGYQMVAHVVTRLQGLVSVRSKICIYYCLPPPPQSLQLDREDSGDDQVWCSFTRPLKGNSLTSLKLDTPKSFFYFWGVKNGSGESATQTSSEGYCRL